jgi:branched-chain amino acid transport system permease protein
MAVVNAGPTGKNPSPYLSALKEAGATAFIVFMLTILMVGFQTQALQGQPLSFITRFDSVFWAVVLVPAGRFLMALDRQGISRPAIVGGLIGFLYLFGSVIFAWVTGAVGTATDNSGATVAVIEGGVPLPFADPIANAIFGLGSLFVAAIAWSTLHRGRGEGLTLEAREAAEESRMNWARRASGILGPILVAVAVALPWTPWADRALVETLTLILTYVMLGWGLNIVVGLAGLLDLGYVAFYAVGAYSYAKFSIDLGLSFWQSLPLAGLMAASFGVLLGFPVLRLRGDYLAIVTLGFGEMVRIVLVNWQAFTGGPAGIGGISRITFFGLPFERSPAEGTQSFHTFFDVEFSTIHRIVFLYYVILVLALITNFVTIRLRKLPIGRAWEALREDETACRALGINPTNTKLTAFAIGAMFAGFAGSFFAVRQLFISPESFVFIESAIILAIVVLGGMGSQVGVALAAILLIGLPEVLRELSLYRMLVFGAVMVLIMLWRPKGLLAHREPTILLNRGRAAARRKQAA